MHVASEGGQDHVRPSPRRSRGDGPAVPGSGHEAGALDATPRSVTEIARTIGLLTKDKKLSGTARKRVTDALYKRPGVLLSQEIRHGQAVTLYRWELA